MAVSNVERELGTIVARLDSITQDLKEAKEVSIKNQSKIEEALGIINSLKVEVEDAKPVVEQFKKWKLVGTGVVLTVGVIATTLGATLSTAAYWIKTMITSGGTGVP